MRKMYRDELGPRRTPGWLIAAALFAIGAAVTAAQSADPGPAPAAAPAAPAVAASPAKTKAPEFSAFEMAMKGGIFMIPLALCSLGAMAVIIERFISLRSGRIIPSSLAEGLRGAFRSAADQVPAMEYCRSQDNPAARVVGAGIAKTHKGEEAMEKAIEDAGANEVAKLGRNLRALYAIAAVAPMIGLLGTVSGMIKAFQVTSVIVGPEKSQQLAEGIYEALITTYAGLCIAIPALLAYYHFQGRIDRLVSAINDLALETVHTYIRSQSAAPAVSRAAHPEPAAAQA